MRVSVGYPSPHAELEILDAHGDHDPFGDLGPVVTNADVERLAQATRQVHVAPGLKAYLVDVAQATRRSPHLALGVSPRATLALQRVAKARAAAEGRGYVIPDDVKALAVPVLAHRLIVTPEAQLQGISPVGRPGRGPAGRPGPRRALSAGAPSAGAHPPGLAVPLGRHRAPRRRPAARASPSCTCSAASRSASWSWPLLYVRLTRLDLQVDRGVLPAQRPRRPARAGSRSAIRNLRRNDTPVLRLRDPVSGTAGAELLVPPLDQGAAVDAPPTACPPNGGASCASGPCGWS